MILECSLKMVMWTLRGSQYANRRLLSTVWSLSILINAKNVTQDLFSMKKKNVLLFLALPSLAVKNTLVLQIV